MVETNAESLIARLEAAARRLESTAAPDPEFMTVSEAARHLGIGVKALRAAVGRGEVRTFGLGTKSRGRPRVRLGEVREWALATAFDAEADARQAGELAARQVGKGRSAR